jgi:ubiquinone/menaquinone biosynthesis C-methylase UbiE
MPAHLKYLSALPFKTLIDTGCGAGEFIVEAAALRPEARFIGVDVSRDVLDEARQRVSKSGPASRVEFVCGDCSRFPLAAEVADVVTFRGLLHHVEDIGVAFAEARRILRAGGRLIVQDGEEMPAPLFEEMNAALMQSGLAPEVHPGFNVEELAEKLNRHDLATEAVIRDGVATFATPPYTPRVYSTSLFLLSAKKMAVR